MPFGCMLLIGDRFAVWFGAVFGPFRVRPIFDGLGVGPCFVCVCCHLNQADFGVVQDVIKNQWPLRITENPEKSTPSPLRGSFFGHFGYRVGSALHLISNNYGKKAKKSADAVIPTYF